MILATDILDWIGLHQALPTWGDGRLFILGENGYIEIRKNIDLINNLSGNHLYYVNNSEVKYIDCSNVKLKYFSNLITDVINRTEIASNQKHNLFIDGACIRSPNDCRK